MLGLKTLVLQPNFLPKQIIPRLSMVSAELALVSVMTGDVDCIKNYDRKVLTPSRTDLQWPSIVVERKMYVPYTEAKLSNPALFYRDHGYCQYCEKQLTPGNVTRDHVIPTSRGGPDHWTNVVAACKTCNAAKDDKMPTGIWIPKRKPYQPSLAELFDRRKDFPVWVGEHAWTDYIGPWRGQVNLLSKFECEAV